MEALVIQMDGFDVPLAILAIHRVCLRRAVGPRHVTAAPGVSLLLTDKRAISVQYLCAA